MRAVAYVVVAFLLTGSIAQAQYAPPVSRPGSGYRPAAPPAAASPVEPAWSPPPNQAIPTRQSSFVIPFSVDESEELPIEVQLFVSDDQGASWHLYARQRPSEKQFRFRAVRDGEYWFAPKTVDRNNQVRPAGPPQPELRMLVDTTQPGLQFDARIGRSGEVRTSWEARDANLAPTTLVVEYQDAVGSRWRPVAIDPPGPGQPPGAYLGAVNWWPETSSRALNVRAEIQDVAGNRTVVNRQVILPRNRPTPSTPQDTPTQETARQEAGSGAGQGRLTSSSTPPRKPSSVPSDPFTRPGDEGAIPWLGPENPDSGSSESHAAADLAATPSGSPEMQPPYQPSPGSGPAYGDDRAGMVRGGMVRGGMVRADAGSPGGWSETSSDRSAGFRRTPGWETPGWETPRPTTAGRDSNYKPISGPSSLPLAERPTPTPPDAPRQRHFGLPPGERPQVTNRRKFGLEYDVDAVGPAGVAAVELWATTDGGHTWTRWGEDTDRTSPFDVEVDSEGVFGFRVVIVGNNGLASQPPRSGDLADIWIAVDTTSPQGRLTSAVYGQAHEAGHLIIQWKVDDDWLAPRPITLLFSGKLDGPWTTIASGLPNDGRYVWKADSRLPRQFYLRMEVRDEAGNVGTYQLNDPIGSEGLTPKGRIRGIRP